MNIKELSAAAHLIHSRLQLIRNRLNIFDLNELFYLLKYNGYYFHKAAESALRDNHFSSERKDMLQAAELFLLSLDKNNSNYHFAVLDKHDSIAVTSRDKGVTKIPANSKDRYTQEQAKVIKDDIATHHGIAHYIVSAKWELS